MVLVIRGILKFESWKAVKLIKNSENIRWIPKDLIMVQWENYFKDILQEKKFMSSMFGETHDIWRNYKCLYLNNDFCH